MPMSMHTSPANGAALSKGDVIETGGRFVRITAHPVHGHNGNGEPVARLMVTPITTPDDNDAYPVQVGLNEPVPRVVGARTAGH